MIQIIPAIDIIDGKCVRLEQGDYSKKKIYSADPLEMARTFESWGIKQLHLVDLDGAKAKKIINNKVLNSISSGTGLIVDFGGGIRTENDVRIAFENGAAMITGGSIAVQKPLEFLEWINKYGNERIILGADHNNEKISFNGWTEDSKTDLFPFLEDYIQKGVKKIICTDIQKDGMLEGPSLGLYKRILNKWPGIQLIASGGVSTVQDLIQLQKAGITSAIVGKAIYENHIGPKELKQFLV
jgi:phosphoribosylformimino-5-aminoimidazole carboxamide ribotide isomerase